MKTIFLGIGVSITLRNLHNGNSYTSMTTLYFHMTPNTHSVINAMEKLQFVLLQYKVHSTSSCLWFGTYFHVYSDMFIYPMQVCDSMPWYKT